MLETPVLFLIFNRPENTQKVFSAIREARPKQLFVAADGPRYPLKGEVDLCTKTRAIIKQIDWPCEIKTLFRDQNLGCGRGVSTAITWFFDQVEAGIILEDDCVPSQDFFIFCEQGLKKFVHDKSVMMLAGTNYFLGKYSHLEGFIRANHYAIWGWATWRRAWKLYTYDLSEWGKELTYSDLKGFFSSSLVAQRWAYDFDRINNGSLETWDVQWVYACIKNKATSIALPANMVTNIGYYGGHANSRSKSHDMPYQKANVALSLNNELSPRWTNYLNTETYRQIGYLYQEPKYKILGRALMKKFPLLRKIYNKCRGKECFKLQP